MTDLAITTTFNNKVVIDLSIKVIKTGEFIVVIVTNKSKSVVLTLL